MTAEKICTRCGRTKREHEFPFCPDCSHAVAFHCPRPDVPLHDYAPPSWCRRVIYDPVDKTYELCSCGRCMNYRNYD